MPYIRVRCNRPLDDKTVAELQKELGKTIELFPGKTESWLMTDCEGDCALSLAGKNGVPLAMIEVELLGSSTPDAYSAVTAKLTEVMERLVGIPAAGVYVKYESIEYWGWNGSNF